MRLVRRHNRMNSLKKLLLIIFMLSTGKDRRRGGRDAARVAVRTQILEQTFDGEIRRRRRQRK